jgi:hypothetical protein
MTRDFGYPAVARSSRTYNRRLAELFVVVLAAALAGLGLILGRRTAAGVLGFGALMLVMVDVIYSTNMWTLKFFGLGESKVQRFLQKLGAVLFGALAAFVFDRRRLPSGATVGVTLSQGRPPSVRARVGYLDLRPLNRVTSQ